MCEICDKINYEQMKALSLKDLPYIKTYTKKDDPFIPRKIVKKVTDYYDSAGNIVERKVEEYE